MSDSQDARRLRDEVEKRLTLNWLIQGAAVHAGCTAHHLVRDELAACSRHLPALYDKFGVAIQLQYWRGESVLHESVGWLIRILTGRRGNPISGHRLIARFGRELSKAARVRTLARAKEKGVTRWPILFSFQVVGLLPRVSWAERGHGATIERLARSAAGTVFGIPVERFEAALVARGKLDRSRFPMPRSFSGVIFSAGIVSWNDVAVRDGVPVVRAQAVNGCLLISELVKGTAELICLHGLNELDDETYAHVIREADRIEFEPWMIKTGGELWRRLLAVLPGERSTAEMLMNMARLPPRSLESLMIAVLERPDWARELLAALGSAD